MIDVQCVCDKRRAISKRWNTNGKNKTENVVQFVTHKIYKLLLLLVLYISNNYILFIYIYIFSKCGLICNVCVFMCVWHAFLSNYSRCVCVWSFVLWILKLTFDHSQSYACVARWHRWRFHCRFCRSALCQELLYFKRRTFKLVFV